MSYSIKNKSRKTGSRVTGYIGGLLVLFVIASGTAFAQKSERVSRKTISLGAQNQRSIYGGFADLKTGSVYSLADVDMNRHKIDLVYAWGKNTHVNLMMPSSNSLRAFGGNYRRQIYEGWDKKNRGTLIALENNRENRRLFRRIKNNKQLLAAYDTALRTVSSRPGYSKRQHGPQARLQKLEIGDYVLIRSRDRNVYAMGRITDLNEGYRGHITLDLKVSTN